MLTIQRLVDGTYQIDLHHDDGIITINHSGVYQRIGDVSDAEPDPQWKKFRIITSPSETFDK